ncbi:class I SAM-dependent methyltransferase [Prosthecochloris sp. HL-130-GSB]|jgi:predicted O-methyltransferase YrrM|uniref:class I SAM-dependent methyltransferase n=1 Tax=Prosthecochloris sp. HL-130-GSB TaxID=1974213 RepID=UPI000A1C07F0|nr:class I SAM-dependent methyltransferase [Prosthecochloris sp. HL-130-GSB]ARM30265.1 hypothetical protein B9H02_01645 [Prosthecochloris sp. HL-130-GSB]
MRACAQTLSSELTARERGFLTDLLQTRTLSGTYLEIGTAAGGTLVEMIRACREHQYQRFVVVDPMTYFNDQLNLVRKNLQQNGIDPDQIDIRVKNSDQAFLEAVENKEEFDFILIDGNHRIKYVMQDLRWAQLLRKGGLLCLHDYAPHEKGVKLAANRFIRKNPHYRRLGLHDTLLALQKTGSVGQEVTTSDLVWAYALNGAFRLERAYRKHNPFGARRN